MPKKLHRKLKRIAKKRGYGKKRTEAYVFGTLRKLGWKPKRENTKICGISFKKVR